MITIREVREAVARGWTTEENSDKAMDHELAEAIAQEVWKMLNDLRDEFTKFLASEQKK